MAFYDVNGGIAKPNALATMQQSYAFGFNARQQQEEAKRQNQLRALAPAIVEGDPAAYAQGAALDPEGAQRFQQAGDAQLRRLRGFIDYVEQARATGNPTAVNAALRAGAPFLSQLTGGRAPTEWTPDMDAGWEQLKAKVSMAGQAQGTPAQMQVFEAQARAAGLVPGSPEYIKAAKVAMGLEGRASSAGYGFDMVEDASGTPRPQRRNPRTGAVEVFVDEQGAWMPLGGGAPQAAPAPTPGPRAPVPQALVAAGPDGVAEDEFASLPAAVRMRVAELEAAGQPFHIVGGRLVEGESAGLRTPQPVATSNPTATPTVDRVPINELGGGSYVPSIGRGRRAEDKAAAEAEAKARVERLYAPGTAAATEAAKIDAELDARPRRDELDTQKAFDLKAAEARAERAEAQRGQGKAYGLYATASRGLYDALSATATNPVAGSLPAVTADAQTAEGAIAAMAPVLKQLFRQAGEGVFTDKDQALLIAMLPTRMDHPEAREAKLANIDAIVRSKLAIDGGGSAGGDAPVAGARKAPDGNWYVQQDGKWFKVDP